MNFAIKTRWIRYRYLILLCLIVTVMTGCASLTSERPELINELVIRNNTTQALHDVALRILQKNIVVSTNLILSLRDYALGFPEREYDQGAIILSWTHNNINYSRQIEMVTAKGIDTTIPARVVITISDGGQLDSRIELK